MKRFPAGNSGFRRTALRSHRRNSYTPMRGGIRL
jgi:hypothetical protein